MERKITVLACHEASSMVSTWKEYLCLSEGQKKAFRLFVGRYAPIGEVSDHYDEETETYNIPDTVDGVDVVDVEDGYLVGGELTEDPSIDEPYVEFDTYDDSLVGAWIRQQGWEGELQNIELKKLRR